MFRRFLTFSAVAVFTFASLATSSAQANDEIYQKISPSVAYVNVVKNGKKIGHGTAWVVDQKLKWLITNDHVASAGDELHLYFPQFQDGEMITDMAWYEKNVKPIRARVVHREPRKDLAVIQAEELPKSAKELRLAPSSPTLGERVHTVGHPGNVDHLWAGNSSNVEETGHIRTGMGNKVFDGQLHRSNLKLYYGASGSPVVNGRGEVVGVVFWGLPVKVNGKIEIHFPGSVDVSELRTVLDTARKKAAETEAGMTVMK